MEEQVIAGRAGRVSRIDEHVLQIKFAGGERRFADEPPHEPLDGLHWRFCGYSNLTRAYLIGKNHFGRFTGVLLLEDNGIILNAGHTVLFSPSGIAFLAIEQEDGMGGELWSVTVSQAKSCGAALPGFLKRDPGNTYDFVSAQYDKPKWNNELNIDCGGNLFGFGKTRNRYARECRINLGVEDRY